MRMVAAWLLLAVFSSAGCSVPLWREGAVRHWPDATGAQQLERLFWEDVKAKRWTELEKHLSATFVAVTPAGRFSRAQALEQLKAIELNAYTLSDCEVQPNGRDATVSCALALQGTSGGQPLSAAPLRSMTVWQNGSHGWMAIAHSTVEAAAR
jgi:hypothetical protein